MSLVLVPRRYNEIAAWMHRARNINDRPMPMLVVSGPVGCGKTAAIETAARAANVHLISVGSDDDTTASKVVWDQWKHVVRSYTLDARVLFIDDGDALLDNALGIKLDEFINLGAHQMPVVVTVADWFAGGSLLSALRTKQKSARLEPVRLPMPTCEAVARQLAIEFPPPNPVALLSSEERAEAARALKRVAVASNGDLRRARFDAQFARETIEKCRAGVIGINSSPFDQIKALLGVSGTLPAPDVILSMNGGKSTTTLETLVHTHHASALPDESIEAAALHADILSTMTPLTQRYCSLIAVPNMIRREQRRLEFVPSHDAIDLAQPLSGSGQKMFMDARRNVRQTVAALDRWQLHALGDRLVSCDRGVSDRAQTTRVAESSALQRFWRHRDVAMHCWRRRRRHTDIAKLPDFAALATAIDAQINDDDDDNADRYTRTQKKRRHPWDKVATIGAQDAKRSTAWRK